MGSGALCHRLLPPLTDPLPSSCVPTSSFGLAPAAPLQVHAPLAPNQSVEISLPLNTVGSVMKMDPLNNLQVGNGAGNGARARAASGGGCGAGSG